MSWNPAIYLKFGSNRLRPAVDLLNSAAAAFQDVGQVKSVLDLGCGPGNVTNILCRTFPNARVEGLDSSKEMIDQAMLIHRYSEYKDRISFRLGSIEDALEQPEDDEKKYDVVYSNAALHWTMNHDVLFPNIAKKLVKPTNSVFAVQMPDTRTQKSHVLMETAALRCGLLDAVAKIRIPRVEKDLEWYHKIMFPLSKDIDLWTTEYLQALPTVKTIVDDRGLTRHPVLEYTRSTGLLPIIQSLGGEQSEMGKRYMDEYEMLLEEEYPAITIKNKFVTEGKLVTLMPFKRFFLVCKF